jgi:murein DD-endopeptidase MepM/ murein hydrolase activator NlpD
MLFTFWRMLDKNFISILQQHKEEFFPVVPFDPLKDKLTVLDFSKKNNSLPGDVLSDTKKFTAYIQQTLENAGARYVIGGYGELRSMYQMSKLFEGETTGEEPRRFHLGMDIWGRPYTKVMAPLEGILHSYAFNNNFGDYGATIILSHVFYGYRFYTLYGHLSLNSIKDKQEGQTIKKGDVFAEFGIPMENGHWPPHLHFQLIRDIGNMKGDYPGVCKFSEREVYLNNCPDPDLLLGLNQYIK